MLPPLFEYQQHFKMRQIGASLFIQEKIKDGFLIDVLIEKSKVHEALKKIAVFVFEQPLKNLGFAAREDNYISF